MLLVNLGGSWHEKLTLLVTHFSLPILAYPFQGSPNCRIFAHLGSGGARRATTTTTTTTNNNNNDNHDNHAHTRRAGSVLDAASGGTGSGGGGHSGEGARKTCRKDFQGPPVRGPLIIGLYILVWPY